MKSTVRLILEYGSLNNFGMKLRSLSEKWETYKQLRREKIEEAKSFYREKIFPEVFDLIKSEYEGKYEIGIFNVGGTPEPIILSVKALNPKKIYLVL